MPSRCLLDRDASQALFYALGLAFLEPVDHFLIEPPRALLETRGDPARHVAALGDERAVQGDHLVAGGPIEGEALGLVLGMWGGYDFEMILDSKGCFEVFLRKPFSSASCIRSGSYSSLHITKNGKGGALQGWGRHAICMSTSNAREMST